MMQTTTEPEGTNGGRILVGLATSWPLLTIGVGLGMVWRAFAEPAGARDQPVHGS